MTANLNRANLKTINLKVYIQHHKNGTNERAIKDTNTNQREKTT
jgi:hypothetical protein